MNEIVAPVISEEYLINITPQETRVALIEQGAVQELHIERASELGSVGAIYMGKIVRVLPGMQSAFIELGMARTAFLYVGDILNARKEDGSLASIESLVTAGQTILVQVAKDPIGTKGARLTTQIALAGRLLVYMPFDSVIGVSQRIADEAERERLHSIMVALLPPDEKGGFILRTVAVSAKQEELEADIIYLRQLWQQIQENMNSAVAPYCLHRDLTLAQRVLRDFAGPSTTRIVVDSRENFQKLMDFANKFVPNIAARIQHYSGTRPLFELHRVEEEVQKALSRRVELKSGGYLIVDQTEAMTIIDVNTGGFVGTRNFDDTVFKTNLEAALTIARQLRLRNLGGIIIIDFIDMSNLEHREAVLVELGRILERDRTRVTISGFTQLGLVEMTRKRTRESLTQILCETCPTCSGRGEIKTKQTVCYEVLRDLLREARLFSAREYRVIAAPAVVDLLLDDESQSVALLSEFISKPISLQAESGYVQEQYDIVLL